jgi:hypothetical protein
MLSAAQCDKDAADSDSSDNSPRGISINLTPSVGTRVYPFRRNAVCTQNRPMSLVACFYCSCCCGGGGAIARFPTVEPTVHGELLK